MSPENRRLGVTVVALLLAFILGQIPIAHYYAYTTTVPVPIKGLNLDHWVGAWLLVALLSWGLGRRAKPGKRAPELDKGWVGVVALALGAWTLWLTTPTFDADLYSVELTVPFTDIPAPATAVRVGMLLVLGALVGLVEWVDRRGLGHGVVLLWLLPSTTLQAALDGTSGLYSGEQKLILCILSCAALAIGAAAAHWMARPARTALAAPVSGAGHLLLGTFVLCAFPHWNAIPAPIYGWLFSPDYWPFWLPMLAAVPVLAWWSHPPDLQAPWLAAHPEVPDEARGLATSQAPGLARARLWSTVRPTAMVFLGLALIDNADITLIEGIVASLSLVFIGGALVDLHRDWQAIRSGVTQPVWTDSRLYVLGPIEAALAAEGIHAHYRNYRLRTLMGLFGPFVRVEVRVHASQVDQATRILDQLEAEATAAASRLNAPRAALTEPTPSPSEVAEPTPPVGLPETAPQRP